MNLLKHIIASDGCTEFEILVARHQDRFKSSKVTALRAVTAAFPESHREWLAAKQSSAAVESREMPAAAQNYAAKVKEIHAERQCSLQEAQLAARETDPQGYQAWLDFHQAARAGHSIH